jgi:hypothetical protein
MEGPCFFVFLRAGGRSGKILQQLLLAAACLLGFVPLTSEPGTQGAADIERERTTPFDSLSKHN